MADSVNSNKSNAFIIGYGGWVGIKVQSTAYYDKYNENKFYINPNNGHTLVQVTNASITRQRNIPMVNSYYLPIDATNSDNTSAKAPIILGEGVYNFSGELSFELTNGTIGAFFNDSFFNRKSWFEMIMFDGYKQCSIGNCVWSSFSISCEPNSLVNVNISFQSNNSYLSNLQVSELQTSNTNSSGFEYNKKDLLVPYWTCGHELFQNFNVSFERNITPVFLNGNRKTAAYLRPGLVNVSVNATTLNYYIPSQFLNGQNINLKFGTSKTLTLKQPQIVSNGYNMPSINDVGTKSYSWTSIGSKSSYQVYHFS